jgi:hypothetical protein
MRLTGERGCRVASSQVRDADEAGGKSGNEGRMRMKRKMRTVTGESPLRLSSTKGTKSTRKEMTKRGVRLRGMRRSGRERGQVT